MTDTINTYFAILIITIAGALSSLLLVRVAYSAYDITYLTSATGYSDLHRAILERSAASTTAAARSTRQVP